MAVPQTKTQTKGRTIFYSGVFLLPDERKKLLEVFPPKFQNIHADHLTLTYDVSPDEMSALEIGKKITLKIIGLAEDDKAQALIIDTTMSSNANPHITLSTDPSVRPVYSNELIEKSGYKKLDTPIEVEGVIGLHNGKTAILERESITKIILPTRIQPDTLIAIFLLKTLGGYLFTNIDKSEIACWSLMPEGETPDTLRQKGVLLLDLGGGAFDHHGKTPPTTSSDLIAEYLGMKELPALSKLLEYARRDDLYGKGTISNDPLDRAFGLSGLMAALNKNYKDTPGKIVDILLPLIEAHYQEEHRRTEELPREFKEKEAGGAVIMFQVNQKNKSLKVVMIESSNPSMPGYLRSQGGGAYDVVAQTLPSGHTNILTRPVKKVDLRSLVAMIRNSEFLLLKKPYDSDMHKLAQSGRLEELPQWYYDPATNSLLNGGVNPQHVEATKIQKAQLHKILELGLSEKLWNPDEPAESRQF